VHKSAGVQRAPDQLDDRSGDIVIDNKGASRFGTEFWGELRLAEEVPDHFN
jgi:hypothetical protein